MTALVDTRVRTRAVRELGASMTLNAGAGSGKTSVLTERIVALLEERRDLAPREVAAITFTEKAAGELLARVRDLLEARLAAATAANETARAARLEQVLARFGELTLSTIHSFCRDLLRQESLESGFAPATEITDEPAADELLARAVRGWLADLRERRPELWRIVERLSSFWHLERAAKSLCRYRRHADIVRPDPLDATRALAELQRLRREIAQLERRCRTPGTDKLIAGNQKFLGRLDAALAIRDPLEATLEVLLGSFGPYRKGGTKKDWGTPENRQDYLEALEAVLAWRARWRESAHGEVVRDLRAHLLPGLAGAKHEESVASFDDLLLDAADLLRGNAAARARLSRRYLVILIDEVQDTDPVQAEVAMLLTRAAGEPGPWHAAPPEPGRLFAVGDPKQSIYRFRGADVQTFGRLEGIVPEANRASLAQNFRSVPGIVAWVNRVFGRLPGYAPQVAHRGPAELEPVVLLEASEEVDEIEAVIRHLKDLFARGARVIDRPSGEPRPLEPRDVMLLLPAWSQADRTADRLRDARLECIVEGGDTFFYRDEVRLGVSALRALVEPADGEAVVFVLRGLFGLGHEELARHAAAKGSFRYTLPERPPGRVSDALGTLLALHRGLGKKGLSGLLDELLEETRAPAVWSLLPDGEARLANLDKLRAMVRAAESRTTSPFQAMEELRRLERTVADKDIDRIDDDGNAIRITTLFKAKGLEAPLVVLLHARRNASGVGCVVDELLGEVAVPLGELLPPGWKELEALERAQQGEERRRWIYVAATRARDQLVICRPARQAAGDLLGDVRMLGFPDAEAKPAHDETVALAEGVCVKVRRAEELAAPELHAETFPGEDALVDRLLADPPMTGDGAGEARERELRELVRAATRGCVRWRAASSSERPIRWQPGAVVEGTAESVGTRGGKVIHAVMERLDLSRSHAELSPVAAELARLLGKQAGLPGETVEACTGIVLRILKNPLLEKARKAKERWHEVPFAYPIRQGSVISGTIDLCFSLDDARTKWVVFDWKSRVPPRTDRLHEKYREQLKKYAQALLQNLGEVEVVETEIVGPYPELGEVATAEEVLVEVRGDLRARLGELLELGVPMPLVGYDAGEPAVTVELCWEEKKLAVAPDLDEEDTAALEAQGWTVRRSLDEEVAALLGIAAPRSEDS